MTANRSLSKASSRSSMASMRRRKLSRSDMHPAAANDAQRAAVWRSRLDRARVFLRGRIIGEDAHHLHLLRELGIGAVDDAGGSLAALDQGESGAHILGVGDL